MDPSVNAQRPVARIGIVALALALALAAGCGSATGPVSQATDLIPDQTESTPTPEATAPTTEATSEPTSDGTADSDPTPTAESDTSDSVAADTVVGTSRKAGAAVIDPLTIQSAATSHLAATASFSYTPANTLDDNLTTAWNHDSQNNVIPGVSQELIYQFAEPTNIDRLEIVNGYAQSEDAYSQNARVQRLRLSPEPGDEDVTWNLEDTQQLQSIDGLAFENVRTLSLIVESVYPGSDYLDTAITDVYFIRYGPAAG